MEQTPDAPQRPEHYVFGRVLAAHLSLHGWSAERFGDLVGVSRQTVHAWTSGTSAPKGQNLARVEELVGSNIGRFLTAQLAAADPAGFDVMPSRVSPSTQRWLEEEADSDE